ncbi:MAG: 50S ribosomal protein L11 methyltransferase, partial [Pseudomonadota bacterium]
MTSDPAAAGTVVKFQMKRGDAEQVDAALELLEPVPSISAFAPEEGAEVLEVEAYFAIQPDPASLAKALVGVDYQVEALPAVDWVSHSQAMLPAITARRFHVYGAHAKETLKPGQIGLWIEANQAFGTGRHETTFGCLKAIDWLTRRQRFKRALDLGCGSGVLGFALHKAQPCSVMMSDMDPVSVVVALENAKLNGITAGHQARRSHALEIISATGMGDRRIQKNVPYDLVLANILARPLEALARNI